MVDFTTEAPKTLDNGMVSINFVASDGVNTLSDAIVLHPEIFASWTTQDTEAEQQRRWSNWLSAISPSEESIDINSLEEPIDG